MLRANRLARVLLPAAALVLSAFLLYPRQSALPEGSIVAVRLPAAADPAGRFPEGAEIVRFSGPGAAPEALTPEFASAAAPSFSFDGARLVFSGKKSPSDPWEIWEMPAAGGAARRLAGGFRACTAPFYLTDGQVVFSAAAEGAPEAFALYRTEAAGPPTRITYHPGAAFAAGILGDGRVLYAAEGGLYAVRHDGTGAELFYGGAVERARYGLGRVLVSDAGGLTAVEASQPLTSGRRWAAASGQFGGADFTGPNAAIAAYRPGARAPFALRRVEGGRLGATFYADARFHLVDPAAAAARPAPLGFVSVVDTAKATGELYALSLYDGAAAPPPGAAARVRVVGARSVLGEASVEADGSFRLELPGDTPVRLQGVDAEGRPVTALSGWMWLRPGEQRGCVGCHENREFAPENRVALAITKPAVRLGIDAPAGAAADAYTAADKH